MIALLRLRRNFQILMLFTGFLLLIGSSNPTLAVSAHHDSGQTVIVSVDPWVEYASHRIIVKVRENVTLDRDANQIRTAQDRSGLEELLLHMGATNINPLMASANAARADATASNQPQFARIYRVYYNSSLSVSHAVALLAADPDVEYAEPDYIARPAIIPDDPRYSEQWALSKVNAPAAWDVTTGVGNIVIAVVDSGVLLDHAEFGDRLWVNPHETAGTGVDNDGNGYVDDVHGWNFVDNSASIADATGHGTGVAAVAGAATNNGAGMAGMCWNCRLMFANAMQPTGIANYSDIAAAVAYAASNGADVINISLGGYADSAMLRDAIRDAATNTVIVAGAGNDDSATPFYPAAYPEVIAVAATDEDDKKAVFSNYGPWIDVAAPGKDILTITTAGYARIDGTSLSAPLVAGLAGLIRSVHPEWSPELVRWQILNTATAIDASNPGLAGQMGMGRMNAEAALASSPQPRASVTGYTLDGIADARPAPGDTVNLAVMLHNQWLPAYNLQASLTSSDPYVTILQENSAFASIDAGKSGTNGNAPFQIRVGGNAPYNHPLALRLTLSGDSGYSLSLNFTVPVRSAVETLGNTVYTANTTWASDKVYVLNGTVIVGEGAVLTIQPGTVIRGNPARFIRVDGTLIAQGTPEQPILFTSNDADQQAWGGVRFTESAVGAQFDAHGMYQGGSILQHVELAYAEIGVRFGVGSAPYVADSHFHKNGTAIEGENGAVRIERNTIEGGGIVIPGGAIVAQNTIRHAQGCAIQLQGGSPLIMENDIFGGECGIGGHAQFPAIVSNTVRSLAGQGQGIFLHIASFNSGDSAPLPGFLPQNRFTELGAGGQYHTCAVLEDASVSCWGNNHYGQLGTGERETVSESPTKVRGLSGAVRQVVVGDWHTCALLENGAVQCWGQNDRGQLGTGNFNQASSPQSVAGLSGAALRISSRYDHVCVLLEEGKVECWGEGVHTPQAVDLPEPVIHMATGFGSTCIILQSGAVACGGTVPDEPSVISGFGGSPIQLTLGAGHACALLDTGVVQCWGQNHMGQLGIGTLDAREAPEAVVGLSDAVVQVKAGRSHTCALLTHGGVQCWGGNQMGQLGTGDYLNTYTPQAVSDLAQPVVQLETGREHTCALLMDGSGQCWGYNGDGQLGTGDRSSTGRPQDVLMGAVYLWGNVVHYGASGIGVSLGETSNMSGQLKFVSNSVVGHTSAGVYLDCWNCGIQVVRNTIVQNGGNGIDMRPSGPFTAVEVQENNLFGNGAYDIYLEDGPAGSQNFEIAADSNFWNLPGEQVAGRVRDCTFDDNGCGAASSTLAKVNIGAVLSEPVVTAPAFVRQVAMSTDIVGVEKASVLVDFSRPMDTAFIPQAIFHDARRGTTEMRLDYPAAFVTKDVIGRLWFGYGFSEGAQGVHMYDGTGELKHFTSANSGLGGDGVLAIYGAANGDVWLTHYVVQDEAWLSRLQDSTWFTYSHQLADVDWSLWPAESIGEGPDGDMWFGTHDALIRYDGVNWRRYTADDGLVHNTVYQIARDSQGDMWFRTNNGISIYDGENWQTLNRVNGLRINSMQPMLIDSQGRVWVSLNWSDDPGGNVQYVAMYDGVQWTTYGQSESNEHLDCSVEGFAEAPDSAIWIRACHRIAIFRDGTWVGLDGEFGWRGMLLDDRGNLWYGLEEGQYVRWGGLDYAFEDGEWLSPTRFKADYEFTPAIPRGHYQIQMGGAVGSDGLRAFDGSVGGFEVNYGGAIATLPPLPPIAQAATSGSLNHIRATWQARDDVDFYRYAIGTFPGGRDVLGWTYLALTSMERNDLQLQPGQSYYVTVQARNSSGLWSPDGISAPIIAGAASLQRVYVPTVMR